MMTSTASHPAAIAATPCRVLRRTSRRTLRLTLLAAALAGIGIGSASHAQIRTDASLGRTPQTLTGPAYAIPQSLGKLAGANLFHSFDTFNLASGESATFSTSTAGIANVISRVTGGAPSNINGVISLQAASGAPAFFFINPAGVTFGAGAAIDVPGAFHVSSADYVQFADGRFHADPKQASTFSSAAPEAFGFLGARPSAITIMDGASLVTSDGALSVVAGDVLLDNAGLASDAGAIRVAAVGGGARSVPLAGTLPALAGRVSLDHEAYVAGGSGALALSAASVTLDGQSTIGTEAPATAAGGAIDVAAAASLTLRNGSLLRSSTSGAGAGGAMRVTAGAVTVDGSDADSRIDTLATADSIGHAGALTLTVAGALAVTTGRIGSFTFGAGDAGAVQISAGSIALDGAAGLAALESNAGPGSSGHAGTLTVSAARALELRNGAQLRSLTWGSGDAGAVTLRGGDITFDGVNTALYSMAVQGSSGNAGAVDLQAQGALAVTNGAAIRTDSEANSGAVSLRAQSIVLDGDSGDSGRIRPATMVASLARGDGDAGKLSLIATDGIAVRNGATINTGSWGAGKAGDIALSAGTLELTGCACGAIKTGLMADANNGGAGANLSIDVAGAVRMARGATVSSSSTGARGGAITVRAASLSLNAEREDGDDPATIVANSSGAQGGSIDIGLSGQLSIGGRGMIRNENYGDGAGGVTRIRAGDIAIHGDGRLDYVDGVATGVTGISSMAYDKGEGGAISVTAAGALSLQSGAMISSSTAGAGHGGQVQVRARDVSLTGELSQISSDAGLGSSGAGGGVDVQVSGALRMDGGARIAADTYASGNAGNVQVRAASLVLDRSRASNSEYYDATTLTRISSSSWKGSSGHGGSVQVAVSGTAALNNGVAIDSITYGGGNAGRVELTAGALRMSTDSNDADAPRISSSAEYTSSGRGGAVAVSVAGALRMDSGEITSTANGSGAPGQVDVSAADIRLAEQFNHWARIRSDNRGWDGASGSPGSVTVRASGNLSVLDGASISSSVSGMGVTGAAGAITLVADSITIGGAQYGGGRVDSSTQTDGNAGLISVRANNMVLGQAGASDLSGLISTSTCCNIDGVASKGNGGRIELNVADTLLLEQGKLLSYSASAGHAGVISIEAGTLRVNGNAAEVRAEATLGSTGRSGSISITAARAVTLSAGASIDASHQASVATPAALAPGQISIRTPLLQLDGATITTSSDGNVDASRIDLQIGQRMALRDSSISTSARDGNGGAITVGGAAAITLDKALVSTSVTGIAGNGGNIRLAGASLLMNTGFVQANTAAADAQGGLVNIDVPLLLASGGTLFAGGATPLSYRPDVFSFNVIQAAAPTGVSGVISLASPLLDLSASLAGLNAGLVDSAGLGRNPCQTSGGSSLALVGRGGLPRSARALLDGAPPGAPPLPMLALAMSAERGCP
ncbi:MAG: filamentous hemagglutinin N-terminal domain-containing protein [Burkholderiaceae bacterium]|nr:filamentous hemagglutinin N-terminal domain-containing protein [Burkholderiaceae bacterium]